MNYWSGLLRKLQAVDGPLVRHRALVVFLADLLIMVFSLVIAFLLRFEFEVSERQQVLLLQGMGCVLVSKLAVFRILGLERTSWRFASLSDLAWLARANLAGSVVFTILTRILVGQAFPRSIYLLDLLLCFLGTAGTRFLVRFFWESLSSSSGPGSQRILIYGAGAAGMMLLRQLRASSDLNVLVAGFLDDDPYKRDATLHGVKVLGGGSEAAQIAAQYRINGIWVAIPSAGEQQQERIERICQSAKVAFRKIPSLAELITSSGATANNHEFFTEELIDRKPVKLDEERIQAFIAGWSVMVTGAGGSIGSELCRRLALYQPERLIALERSEGDLFRIERELKERFPQTNIIAELCDVNDSWVREVIRRHEVNTILHAAAYKHVPMMEKQILQATKNNALGTFNLVDMAGEEGVAHFVLISSDKAVNPTSVMGATKRLSELIVSSMTDERTKCVSVRFGNVLGSSWSVLPLFQAQLAAGGPLTVTDPEMVRYFLTAQEAVQLVMQAATMGRGGETFVLDMGTPVKILHLAEKLIRLSGMEPYKDIPIVFTKAGPGEKLREELASVRETLAKTEHEKIRVVRGNRQHPQRFRRWMSEIRSLVDDQDEAGILLKLQEIIPEYQPSEFAQELAFERSGQSKGSGPGTAGSC